MSASMGETAREMRILLLEDSGFDAELIGEHLARVSQPVAISRVLGRDDYLEALEREEFDIILCDYSLPGFDGLSALRFARERKPQTPFIFVSGVLGEDSAIASFNQGATDYVLKQRLIRLPAAVERAVAEAREREERRVAEKQTRLLVAELSHRVKNTLATVMSIARRTARGARSVAEYEASLISRLRALSDAHALVFESNWRQTDLCQLLERTLEPFGRNGDAQLRLSGPHVMLEPKAALTLSLAFHELATNAAKYGSLSVDAGTVDVTWRFEPKGAADEAEVVIDWNERGGPAVTPPAELGFGVTLLQRSVAHELEGSAELNFDPNGLCCRIRFPAGERAG